MSVERKIEVVPGATHLFEEPGALETVALLASRWFRTYLAIAICGDKPKYLSTVNSGSYALSKILNVLYNPNSLMTPL